MELITVKETAERLNVSTQTIKRWCKDGKMRHFKLGGKTSPIRIPIQEVYKLIRKSEQ